MNPRTIRLVSSTLLSRETIKSEDKTDYIYSTLSNILNGLLPQYGWSPSSHINESVHVHLMDTFNTIAESYFNRSNNTFTSLKLGTPSIVIPIEKSLDTYKWDLKIPENDKSH